jgi:hypothetical protein
MVEDVPAGTGLVDALDQIHVTPSSDATPRSRVYVSRLIPSTARRRATSSKT